MDPITGVIASFVAPAIVCALVMALGLAYRPKTRNESARDGKRGGPWSALGLGLAAIVAGSWAGGLGARVTAEGPTGLYPRGVNDWILLVVLCAVLVGGAQGVLCSRGGHRDGRAAAAGVLLRFLIATGAAFAVLRLLAGERLGGAGLLGWSSALGCATAVVWCSLDRAALRDERQGGRIGALLVAAITAATSGPPLVAWGMVTGGQVALAIASALGVLALLRRAGAGVATIAQGGGAVVALSLGTIWSAASFWTEIPVPILALLWCTPLALWAGVAPGVRQLKGWRFTLSLVLTALIPAGVALALTLARAPKLDFVERSGEPAGPRSGAEVVFSDAPECGQAVSPRDLLALGVGSPGV